MEALAPYRLPWRRAADEPQPLAHLDAGAVRQRGAFDVQLEVLLETAADYHAVVTYPLLGDAVQESTGVRTTKSVFQWVDDVLARVAGVHLGHELAAQRGDVQGFGVDPELAGIGLADGEHVFQHALHALYRHHQIGRASCRERV